MDRGSDGERSRRLGLRGEVLGLDRSVVPEDGAVRGPYTELDDRIWLVTFIDYDLGYFDDETCRLEPLANPFVPKVLPMSPV